MLVVLDPAFFREDGLHANDAGIRARALHRLRRRLDDANRILLHRTLVVATPEVPWLDTIYRREVRTLSVADDRAVLQAIDRIFREHKRQGAVLPAVAPVGAMWGVAMMCDWAPLGGGWREPMERVLAAAAVYAADQGRPVAFLCHRVVGRNVVDRSSGGVELIEVLRWRLSVSVRGAPPTVFPCVSTPRNLSVDWTRRMDERLPDAHGPGLHPYCAPSGWKNSNTVVCRTHQSRPCWRDAQEQWWARPATGGGHHWDVYLNAHHETRIGLGQINVTQHGAPAGEGQPGDLHHVPEDKKHALKNTSGWNC